MPLLSSSDFARIIADRTGFHPDKHFLPPLTATNILTDHGTGSHRRIDATELADFLARYPYRPVMPFDYLQVSLGALTVRTDPLYDVRTLPPTLFSRHAGYDHHNTAGLGPTDRARAIVATWKIGAANAAEVVERGLPLIGVVKGVMTPDTIYWPRAVIPLGNGGFGFDVDPAHRGHDEIGTGAITTVRGGAPWELVRSTVR